MKKLVFAAVAVAAMAVTASAGDLWRVIPPNGAASTYATFPAAVEAANAYSGATVELLGDDTASWDSVATVTSTMTIRSGEGGPFVLQRTSTDAYIHLHNDTTDTTLTVTNIVFDGGALWMNTDFLLPIDGSGVTIADADNANLANTGVGQSDYFIAMEGKGSHEKLILQNGTTFRNVHAGHADGGWNYAFRGLIGPVNSSRYGTIDIYDGVLFRDCRGDGAVINIGNNATVRLHGLTIDHCYAAGSTNGGRVCPGLIRVHNTATMESGTIINSASCYKYSNEDGGLIDCARALTLGAAGKSVVITNNFGYSLGAVSFMNSGYVLTLAGGKIVVRDNINAKGAACDVCFYDGKNPDTAVPLKFTGTLEAGSDVRMSWGNGEKIGQKIGVNSSAVNAGQEFVHSEDGALTAILAAGDTASVVWRDGTKRLFDYSIDALVQVDYDGLPHKVGDYITFADPVGGAGVTVKSSPTQDGEFTEDYAVTDKGVYTVWYELTADGYITVTNKTAFNVSEPATCGKKRVSLDGGATWTEYETFADAIAAANVKTDAGAIVELLGNDNVSWSAAVSVNHTMTVRSGAGGPFVLKRTSADACFNLVNVTDTSAATVTFADIVFDGGAIWERKEFLLPSATVTAKQADDANLAAVGVGQSQGFFCFRGSDNKETFVFASGTTVRNVFAGYPNGGWDQPFPGTVALIGTTSGKIEVYDGARFTDCRGDGAVINVANNANLKFYGGTIDHCYASGSSTGHGGRTCPGVVRIHNIGCFMESGTFINNVSLYPYSSENGGAFDLARGFTVGAPGKVVVITNNYGYTYGAVGVVNKDQHLILGGGKVVIKDNFKYGGAVCNVGIRSEAVTDATYGLELTGTLEEGSDIGIEWPVGASVGHRVGVRKSQANEGLGNVHADNSAVKLRLTADSIDPLTLVWRDASIEQFVYEYDSVVEIEYDGQPHGVGDHIRIIDPATGATVRYAATQYAEYAPTLEYTQKGRYPIWFELSADGYATLTNTLTLFIMEERKPGLSRVSLDGGATWVEPAPASTVAAIALANASTDAATPVVELLSDATFEEKIVLSRAIVIRSGEGGPYTLMRTSADASISVTKEATPRTVFDVVFTNLVLDGGAKWANGLTRPLAATTDAQSAANKLNLDNWGVPATENFIGIGCPSAGLDNHPNLTMDQVTVRNVHAGANSQWGFTGTIAQEVNRGNYERMTFRNCTFRDCRGQGATLNVANGSNGCTLEDCLFESCFGATGSYNWSGVLRFHGGDNRVTRTTVTGCISFGGENEGGAVFDCARSVTIADSTVTNNYGWGKGGLFTPTATAGAAVTFEGRNVIRDNVNRNGQLNVYVNVPGGLKLGAANSVRRSVGVTYSGAPALGDVFGTAAAGVRNPGALCFFPDWEVGSTKVVGRIEGGQLLWGKAPGFLLLVK